MTDDTTTPDPTEADVQAAADWTATMDRLVEGVYMQTVVLGKVANVTAQHLPRLLICAATHGIFKSIEHIRQREAVSALTRQDRSALYTRLVDDCNELKLALTDATAAVAAIEADVFPPGGPTSTFIS